MDQRRLPPPEKSRRRIYFVDIVIIGAVIAAIAYVVHRVDYVLVYNWNWPQVFQYLIGHDPKTGRIFPNILLRGLTMTIRLAIWSMFAAALIGLVMGLCRTSSNLFLRAVARIYVELVRNMPPIVFIFVFYFFISSQIMPALGIDSFTSHPPPAAVPIIDVLFSPIGLFENFLAGTMCLALIEGAYITEIVRAGIQSIGKGQWEAARAVGLSRFNVLRDVILPQAVRHILPPLAGQFITLVKDSSIVSLISVQELTFLTMEVSNTTTRFFESWILTGGLYFMVCYPLAVLFARFEKKLKASGWS